MLPFEKTMKCVKESFSSENWEDAATTNSLIEKELQYWKKQGTGIYPSIVINKNAYRG